MAAFRSKSGTGNNASSARPSGVATRRTTVSFEGIRNGLGFRPQGTIADAVREVSDLLASGEVADFTDERFHNAKWLSANGHLWNRLGAA